MLISSSPAASQSADAPGSGVVAWRLASASAMQPGLFHPGEVSGGRDRSDLGGRDQSGGRFPLSVGHRALLAEDENHRHGDAAYGLGKTGGEVLEHGAY